MQTVTERFARWVDASGVTQTEIARQLGHHKSFVTRLRKGYIRPTLRDASKLERLTGIPIAAWAAPLRRRAVSPIKSKACKSLLQQEKQPCA